MGFAEFFTEMHWVVILLFDLALGFAIAEGLIPGFGICGIISILCGSHPEGVRVEHILCKVRLFPISILNMNN